MVPFESQNAQVLKPGYPGFKVIAKWRDWSGRLIVQTEKIQVSLIFIHFCSKYLLLNCYELDTILSSVDTTVNKQEAVS